MHQVPRLIMPENERVAYPYMQELTSSDTYEPIDAITRWNIDLASIGALGLCHTETVVL